MRIFAPIIALLAFLALSACTSTPMADLYAGQVTLTQLESGAYKYVNLSKCGAEKPGELCKTQDGEKAIKKAFATSEDALAAAKANVTPGSVANFQTALNALSALIPVAINTAKGVQ